MKKHYVLILFVLASVSLFMSCDMAEKEISYTWSITTTSGDYDQPVSKVELLIGENKHLIIEQVDAPMERIAKEDFASKKVPETAMMACGGFWAGYEQIVYLTKKETIIEATLLTFEEGFDTPQIARLDDILLDGAH